MSIHLSKVGLGDQVCHEEDKIPLGILVDIVVTVTTSSDRFCGVNFSSTDIEVEGVVKRSNGQNKTYNYFSLRKVVDNYQI